MAYYKVCNLCHRLTGCRIRRCPGCGEKPVFRPATCEEIQAHKDKNARFEQMIQDLLNQED